MQFEKYAKYSLYGIMGISVILTAIFYFGGVVPGTEGPTPEPKITDVIIKYSYILLVLAVVGLVGFSIFNLIGNPKNVKNIAIILIVAAVIFLISRLLSSGEVLTLPGYKGTDNEPGVLKNVDTALFSTYILLGVTVVAIIYSEIAKLLK